MREANVYIKCLQTNVVGLPRLTEISVTRGSVSVSVSFPDFGSVQIYIYFFNYKRC